MKHEKVTKYSCWFLVNQHLEKKEFESIQHDAEKIFLEFMSDKNYGTGVRGFRFDIYVEAKVNFGRQKDSIYTFCAHLSSHIDKQVFDKASVSDKLKLVLNTSLKLLQYLAERVPLPKDFDANSLFTDYLQFLKGRALLLKQDETNNAVIKFFDTTRFIFRRTVSIEVDSSKIYFDLNDIQDFINNEIAGKTFGKSVRIIDFGFELYDYNGRFAEFLKHTENLKRYGAKGRNYVVVKHFDYSQIKNLDGEQQYQILKSRILEGINDYDNLKTKPKDFEKIKFHDTMEIILSTYDRQKSNR